MLDLEPSGEMVEIIRDPARLDGALLRASMTQHKSGLFVLPAPSEFVPLDALPVAAVVKLIELARAEFDFVVIDLPLAAPRWLEAVLQQTDQLLLVSQLNVAAIRQTRRLLDFLKEEGLYELPVSVVLEPLRLALQRARPAQAGDPRARTSRSTTSCRTTPGWRSRRSTAARRCSSCGGARSSAARSGRWPPPASRACSSARRRPARPLRLREEENRCSAASPARHEQDAPVKNGAMPAPEIAAPDPHQTEQDEQLSRWLDLKTRLHERLLEELNLAAIEKVAKADLRREVAAIVNELLTTEGTALNAKEFGA